MLNALDLFYKYTKVAENSKCSNYCYPKTSRSSMLTIMMALTDWKTTLDADDHHLVIRPPYIIIWTESMFPFDFNQLYIVFLQGYNFLLSSNLFEFLLEMSNLAKRSGVWIRSSVLDWLCKILSLSLSRAFLSSHLALSIKEAFFLYSSSKLAFLVRRNLARFLDKNNSGESL